jgi:hypothetical protein
MKSENQPQLYQTIQQQKQTFDAGACLELSGGLGLSGDFRVEDDGTVVECMTDLKNMVIYGKDEEVVKNALKPFFDADVAVDYKGWEGDSESGEDWEGYAIIKKDELNLALKAEKIKLKVIRTGGQNSLMII